MSAELRAAAQAVADACANDDTSLSEFMALIDALRAALAAAPEQPASLEWADSPQRTQWGAGMMEALLPGRSARRTP